MAGTLACLVTDGKKRFILSNNHVIADENNLPLNSPIYQPGLLDNGTVPGDRIARLAKTIKILKLPKDNHVDAAIAVLDKNTLASALILQKIGKLASTTTVPAVEKMKVHKHRSRLTVPRVTTLVRCRRNRCQRNVRHWPVPGFYLHASRSEPRVHVGRNRPSCVRALHASQSCATDAVRSKARL